MRARGVFPSAFLYFKFSAPLPRQYVTGRARDLRANAHSRCYQKNRLTSLQHFFSTRRIAIVPLCFIRERAHPHFEMHIHSWKRIIPDYALEYRCLLSWNAFLLAKTLAAGHLASCN
jgi:hypothetical protein